LRTEKQFEADLREMRIIIPKQHQEEEEATVPSIEITSVSPQKKKELMENFNQLTPLTPRTAMPLDIKRISRSITPIVGPLRMVFSSNISKSLGAPAKPSSRPMTATPRRPLLVRRLVKQ